MEMDTERINWVAKRAACNLNAKFEELFHAVEYDICEINKLLEKECRGHLFKASTNGERVRSKFKEFRVVRFLKDSPDDPQVAGVTFEKEKAAISIHSPYVKNASFSVCPQWDEQDTSCKLYIGDECCEIWQVSQKALGTFFFET